MTKTTIFILQCVTIAVMALGLAVILGWDLAVTLIAKGGIATESQIILAASYINFSIPFLWGVFVPAHLMTPQPEWLANKWRRVRQISLGVVTLAIIVLNAFLVIPPLYPLIPFLCGWVAGVAGWPQSISVFKLQYPGRRERSNS